MVAGGASSHPPRSCQIAGEDTADRRACILGVQQRAVVRRFELKLLAILGERGFYLHQRCANGRRHDELARFVQADASEGREVEQVQALDRPAERALAAPGDNLQGFLLGRCPGDDTLKLVGHGGAEGLGHVSEPR